MTVLLVAMYVVAAACELLGVGLVVQDIRDSRRRWDSSESDRQREQEAFGSGIAWSLDPMTTRYGFNPWQVVRTINTVDELVGVNRTRQNWAVILLFAGIVMGLVGNLVSLAAS